MDFVLIARTPILELLESGGLKAAEAKMLEIFRKASLVSSPRRTAAMIDEADTSWRAFCEGCPR